MLEFQISDWNTYHELDDEEEDKYVIQIFGRTENDEDVCLKVVDFLPFFYVEIPLEWKDHNINKFIAAVKNKVQWISNNNTAYSYDLSESLVGYKKYYKKKYYNFTNKKKFSFLMLAFKSYTAMKEFARVLSKPLQIDKISKKKETFKLYESNIEPHIRYMHINKLSSCGWVNIDKSKLIANNKYSSCVHSYIVNHKDVKPSSNEDRMAPFKIMGYDIECISCDHNFPQSSRKSDSIIQIGITMYRYGSMNCYEQHLLTLKQSMTISGANVECYRTEKGLIEGWAKKVASIRPDFTAGYNNFNFDDKYIFNRIMRIDKEEAEKQGISVDSLDDKFMDKILKIIGKINNEYLVTTENIDHTIKSAHQKKNPNQYFGPSLSYFEYKNLSSAALGDNEFYFFQIPGIISIDMMKVIQRDHRLLGYKLDNVTANFITEDTKKIEELGEYQSDPTLQCIHIYTASTKALEKDSFIQIMINDGYSSSPFIEGAKFKVLDITTITEKIEQDGQINTYNVQAIKTLINKKDLVNLHNVLKNRLYKLFWTFAKDDMHHSLINKYFNEGDPRRIRQIGKYCLKDCKLVNLLLAKLDIIVNSVAMAKVCIVPISYLFMRGQGVKIFSLVSEKCKTNNFLIPVLAFRDHDADEVTYEGATVINPKPAVYLSPIGVLDFSSLYPNSMRERNLSHECYVNDKAYDNLDGYIYHDIYIVRKDKSGKIIKNIDGTIQKDHHRFAQELISDEQINEELKDIFNNIQENMNKSIEKIKNTSYYTDELLKQRINYLNYKKESLSEVKDDSYLNVKNELEILNKYDGTIKEELSKLNKYIDEIKNDDKMADNIKNDKIKKITDKTNKDILLIYKSIKITDAKREELIKMEKENADKRRSEEKSKKYNIVDGKNVRYGILPEILTELLNKRKETNARLAKEKDPFVKAILNALQLAFKVTANSLYGQTGAATSPIFFLPIAASTTAIGRERLYFAKKTVEDNFPGSEIIYGDTDSIFINFHIKDANGNEKTDTEALLKTIELCKAAANKINKLVPKPQSIVYEKTLHPFILVAKKKYVGLMYTKDASKYELKSMGIVLKRRDNAPIVKILVGGIINYILKNRDIDKAIEYAREVLQKLMDGKYPIDKFIISKTLKAKYKKPQTIAHKVLADRMAERDPGNRPQINDRIPYVYIVKKTENKKKKDILQGDLIEHPDYVISNGLKIDYLYYLEHQIINPASQILELMISKKDVENFFDDFIVKENNKRLGRQNMEKWMIKKSTIASDSSTKLKKLENNKNNIVFDGATTKLKNQDMSKWFTIKKIEENDENYTLDISE